MFLSIYVTATVTEYLHTFIKYSHILCWSVADLGFSSQLPSEPERGKLRREDKSGAEDIGATARRQAS